MTLPDSPEGAHFVPLAVIMSDHGGSLASYIKATGSQDNVITMEVEMEVAGVKGRKFMAAVAVTRNFDSAEALHDAATAECPADHDCVFAWVPADRFGSDDFGIYIEDIGVGEQLQNGLVAEIIEQACVEQAVAAGAGL
ncbi:MAG: hypothetical protein EBT94_10905 [Alphaproteobacteria bacterium]|jgi:hypothetical protein|nr:hypothetical protein [Alphaproteobacteria bacterium]